MLECGHILDRKYEVIKILGKGGMGTVYLCRNITLGNFWAIKQIRQGIKNIDILTEANILKSLSHPGIRKIVDIFYENNSLYMVQDYVEGQTLKEYVKAYGRMQTKKVCEIAVDLCEIISYLHNQNPPILYRDIKPSNIIISASGKVVLIDFGISKVYKTDTDQDTVCAGSNGYAAPEQYGLGKCCKQTDVYGIGMLLYFMVKGENPSTGVEPLLDESYDCSMDESLKVVIQKCVSIDVKDRYFTVEAVNKEILRVLKKDRYEKTVIFNEPNINTNLVNTKITNKAKLKKPIKRSLYFIAIILASAYILYVNKKEEIDINAAVDRPKIVKPIVDSKVVNVNAFKGPTIVPTKVETMKISEKSGINEKASLAPKGRGKKKIQD